MITTARLVRFFVEAADSLVADVDPVDFLQTLVVNAAEISGAEAAGILLADEGGTLQCVAASNDTGRMLELFQLQSVDGPCLDCYATGVPVVNADISTAHDTWPQFAPAALDAGLRSVHAFPMRLRGTTIGTLNLFGGESVRFDDSEVAMVQGLADVATIALLRDRAAASSNALAEQLQSALDRRRTVELATGVLAETHGTTLAEAWEHLREESRRTRRKVVDIADEVVARRNSSA